MFRVEGGYDGCFYVFWSLLGYDRRRGEVDEKIFIIRCFLGYYGYLWILVFFFVFVIYMGVSGFKMFSGSGEIEVKGVLSFNSMIKGIFLFC